MYTAIFILCITSFAGGANIGDLGIVEQVDISVKQDTPVFPPDLPEIPEELNSTSCGDALVAEGGFINYKYEQEYNNNERCIWTIRTPKWQTSFLMHASAFHSLNDYLSVYVVNGDGMLEKKAQIDTATGNRIIGVIGPTVFLVLTTDQTGTGKGFFLEYFGFGYNELSGNVYNHHHLQIPSGSVTWPEKPIEHYLNAFSTFTINPPQLPKSNVHLDISVNKVDLLPLVQGCHHNYFSVHQLFQDGFAIRLRYCEADLLTSAKISSSSPLLITYLSTVGPKQAGISFAWNEEQT